MLFRSKALERLSQEFGLTHQDIAKILSKSRASVTNALRLLQLEAPVKALLEAGKLDMGHARCLLKLSANDQINLAQLIVAEGLSVRKAEALATNLKHKKATETPLKRSADVFSHAFEGRLEHWLKAASTSLGAPIQVKSRTGDNGELSIKFKGASELKRLLVVLKQEEIGRAHV